MTIAISVKINDGVVLAADSASTLTLTLPQGLPQVVTVYNNANKVFNLLKGLPIGAINWGQGAIGLASTSTLMKDLRRRFGSNDQNWRIDPDNYTIEDVATKVRRFFFEELYVPAYAAQQRAKPVLGICVAGYSAGAQFACEYNVRRVTHAFVPVLLR